MLKNKPVGYRASHLIIFLFGRVSVLVMLALFSLSGHVSKSFHIISSIKRNEKCYTSFNNSLKLVWTLSVLITRFRAVRSIVYNRKSSIDQAFKTHTQGFFCWRTATPEKKNNYYPRRTIVRERLLLHYHGNFVRCEINIFINTRLNVGWEKWLFIMFS